MSDQCFAGPGCHTERSGRLREQFEVPAPDQPSIVTYLLLQRPVSLPDWPGYVHRIETPEDAESLDDMSELIRRVVTTRLANVETVFTEVSAGSETIGEVVVKTGLGKKVVQRAMTALEKNGREPACRRSVQRRRRDLDRGVSRHTRQKGCEVSEFKREPRYVVFKIKDIHTYLSTAQIDALQSAGDTIAMGRAIAGKPPFNAVVVEQDWPEFDPTWEAIEARMTANADVSGLPRKGD